MNLIPNLKKKQTGHVAIPDSAYAPAAKLSDLTPLAQLVQPMRVRMKEFDHALHALSVARERQRDLDDVPPPSMALAIQREIVVAIGDAQELARFDAENAQALQAERDAREAVVRDREELPARILALEEVVRRIAKKMIENDATTTIDEEAQTVFQPYAERVMEAAQKFADAMQEAHAVAAALNQAVAIYEYDLFGNLKRIHRPELIGEVKKDEVLPQTMAGVSWEEIEAINLRVRNANPEIRQRMDQELAAADIVGERLRMYIPGLPSDDRKISSPELTRKVNRPEPSPFGVATRVLIGT